jgi:hypothetical protein
MDAINRSENRSTKTHEVARWRFPVEVNWDPALDGWLRVRQSELDKILEKNSTVAGFVLMFPARAGFVPIFERLLEVELYCVDELTVVAIYHHLVAAKV